MPKTDCHLGRKVREHLLSKGLETPLTSRVKEEASAKREGIADAFTYIMGALGLDLSDDSLRETPRRVAKMFIDEYFRGLEKDNFPKCTTIANKMCHGDEMVVVSDIAVHSCCEHHFVPIVGKATVAYIPKDKVLGLSKINRVVDYFARRPQVQERLGKQIAEALSVVLETDDVCVFIDAEHLCVKTRGVKDVGSHTRTLVAKGRYQSDAEIRREFLAGVRP